MKARTAGSVFNSISLLSFFFWLYWKTFQWSMKFKTKKKWNGSVVKGLPLSEIHHLVGWIAKRYFKVCGAGLPLASSLLVLSPTAAWTSFVLAGLCVRNCFKKQTKKKPPNLRRSQTKLWITARSHLDFSPPFCPWLVSSGLSGIQASQGVPQVF